MRKISGNPGFEPCLSRFQRDALPSELGCREKKAWEYSLFANRLSADYGRRLRTTVFPRFPPFPVAGAGYRFNAVGCPAARDYIVADRRLRRGLYSGAPAGVRSLQLRGLAPPPLTDVPRSMLRGRPDRMYTTCPHLAGGSSPYLATGLGICYATTPGTFAFP